jgi:hypothetical protein
MVRSFPLCHWSIDQWPSLGMINRSVFTIHLGRHPTFVVGSFSTLLRLKFWETIECNIRFSTSIMVSLKLKHFTYIDYRLIKLSLISSLGDGMSGGKRVLLVKYDRWRRLRKVWYFPKLGTRPLLRMQRLETRLDTSCRFFFEVGWLLIIAHQDAASDYKRRWRYLKSFHPGESSASLHKLTSWNRLMNFKATMRNHMPSHTLTTYGKTRLRLDTPMTMWWRSFLSRTTPVSNRLSPGKYLVIDKFLRLRYLPFDIQNWRSDGTDGTKKSSLSSHKKQLNGVREDIKSGKEFHCSRDISLSTK